MNIQTYYRRAFLMYPYFTKCWTCGTVGQPTRIKKKSVKSFKCKCKKVKP